ncbi:MAG: calcium/sodium antiporter [Candidatus Gracilibacteria bacterium]|nr:calcium/sodium antiporter [Candidatus Gracilibacteria bacterium]
MDFLLLIIGFVLLIKGADMLVDGSSSIAKKHGISSLVIGLTIVAFGTSTPELVVNMISAFSKETELAISNIVGSNISNIFFILGLTALVFKIPMPKSTVKKEIPFMIFTSALLLVLLLDSLLSRFDALILIFFFILFLAYTFKTAKKDRTKDTEEIIVMSTQKSSVFITIGLAGLILGGKFIVDGAVNIAEAFSLPKEFIGLTIVAVGTSLPELAASIVAAFKKQTDMALGAIVGSNIFNVLWILGATAVINPLSGYSSMLFDLKVELLASMLVFLAAFTFQKNFLTKIEGAILFLFYIGFIIYKASLL